MTIGIQTTRQTVNVLGIETAYYRLKPSFVSASARPVAVLMHGGAPGACSDLNWFTNVLPLAEAGYEVIAYDQPGFGHSASPDDHSIEFRYRHAVATVRELASGPVHLVGNSIGGLLGSLIVLRGDLCDRVRSLTLAAPFPFFDMPASIAERLASHRTRLAGIEQTFESVRAVCLNTFNQPAQVTDDIVRLRLSMLQGANWRAYRERAPASRHFDQDTVRNAVVDVPTLMVWGLNDNSLPHEIGLAAMSHFSDARFLFLPRCGHWPQTEQSDAFNHAMLGFLQARDL